MEDSLLIVITTVAGIIIGFIIAKTIEKSNVSNLIKNAKKEASSILKDAAHEAESIKKEKILQAKERFIEMKAEHENVILSKDKKIAEAEKRTKDKESQVSNELAKSKKLNQDLEAKLEEYNQRVEAFEKKQQEVDKLNRLQIEKLEAISGLSAEEAKTELVENLKADDYFDGNEIQIKLQKAIILLPEKQQLVFKMKYFEELKYEEMSEILTTSVGALKASYHIAVKKIEEYLHTH